MTEKENTSAEKESVSPGTAHDPADANQIPSASLAYLGDSVIEILVREALVRSGVKTPSVVSLKYVTAPCQSDALEKILDILSDEEASVYRRGRNGVHSGIPRNSTAAQYRRATGLEALFGYLYLMGRRDRIRELFSLAYPDLNAPAEDGAPKSFAK